MMKNALCFTYSNLLELPYCNTCDMGLIPKSKKYKNKNIIKLVADKGQWFKYEAGGRDFTKYFTIFQKMPKRVSIH